MNPSECPTLQKVGHSLYHGIMTIAQHADTLKAHGYDLPSLKAVMLKTENIRISDYRDAPDDLFYGEGYDLRYCQGAVGEKTAHLTLHQGILPNVPDSLIDTILGEYDVPEVRISHVSGWPSPNGFTTVVANICDDDGQLLELHNRLRWLPHIDAFPTFMPHITLAFVRDSAPLQSWLAALNELSNKKLKVSGRFTGED